MKIRAAQRGLLLDFVSFMEITRRPWCTIVVQKTIIAYVFLPYCGALVAVFLMVAVIARFFSWLAAQLTRL
ncbi:MAG: hypothetical protein Q7U38_08310 [Methylobacter sp.]|nr:hypothetical protein [Methylobacter sp.]MDP2099629.1 hypothetical protein [Methylobacter sp.]MDP2429825.1 hypothetical protein [Methylobacter sp.]MDP3055545.1 hypothetical protein [Methylobacter sp.]MDP3361351.1 hypothetical protein [Methylobacter sp.]